MYNILVASSAFTLGVFMILSLLSSLVTLTHLKDVRNASHLYEEALKQNKLVCVCVCVCICVDAYV